MQVFMGERYPLHTYCHGTENLSFHVFHLTFLSMVIHSIINTALQGAMQKQNLIITKIYNIPYLQ